MLVGFSRSEAPKRIRNLGTTSSVKAKLWALKDDLNLGQQLGINNINVEMDIEVLVHMFMKPSSINFMLESLLSDCRAVQLVDFLILNEPPPVVEPLLAFDKAKLFCSRLVCC